jgi:effector-binding domain-containing protein
MSMTDVRAADTPAIALAVVRREVRQSEVSKAVTDGCGLVWNFVRAQGLRGGRNVALYWDGRIRLDVGVELSDAFESDGSVIASATPAGPTASVAHYGSYDRLGAAHARVHEWCKSNNRQLAGPSWEIYGHWQPEWNGDPSLIRTDIYYLLTPADESAS